LIWIDFFILRIFEHLGVKSVLTPPEKVEIEMDDDETNKQTNKQTTTTQNIKELKHPSCFK